VGNVAEIRRLAALQGLSLNARRRIDAGVTNASEPIKTLASECLLTAHLEKAGSSCEGTSASVPMVQDGVATFAYKDAAQLKHHSITAAP